MFDGFPDPPPAPASGVRRRWAVAAAAVLLVTAWLLGPGHAAGSGGGSLGSLLGDGRTPGAASGGGGGTSGGAVAAAAPMPAVVPVRLDIPSIGVHAAVVPRGLTDGAVDPPSYATPGVVGWYRGGPAPGAAGAADIVGHVDTETGPAVFLRLARVRPGAVVRVTRADGSVARFTVASVRTVQKAHFDARGVYGAPRGAPELRLITCGGRFDRAAQAYSANVVVRAPLTPDR